MGIEIKIDGSEMEYNTILALRHNKSPDRKPEECLPDIIKEGFFYKFLKDRYRIFPIGRQIPLVKTEGEGRLSDTLAQVIITQQTQYMLGGNIFTKGEYVVTEGSE